jgi:hypothetical protein
MDRGRATLVSTVTVMLLDTLGKDAVCVALTAVICAQTAVSGVRPKGTRRKEELSTVGRIEEEPTDRVTLAEPRSTAAFWRTKEKVAVVWAGMAAVGTAVTVPDAWSQVPADRRRVRHGEIVGDQMKADYRIRCFRSR